MNIAGSDFAAGAKVTFGGVPAGTRAVQLPDTGFNSYFLTVFGRKRVVGYQTRIALEIGG